MSIVCKTTNTVNPLLVPYTGTTYNTADQVPRWPDAHLRDEERLSIISRTEVVDLGKFEGHVALIECSTTYNRRIQPGANYSPA